MNKSFYVYAHYNCENDECPFYIGKGKGSRAYNSKNRTDAWKQRASVGLVVKILQDDLTEEEAYLLETKLIEKYGREKYDNGKLVNVSSGGPSGIPERYIPQHLLEQIKRHMFNTALQDYALIGRLL